MACQVTKTKGGARSESNTSEDLIFFIPISAPQADANNSTRKGKIIDLFREIFRAEDLLFFCALLIHYVMPPKTFRFEDWNLSRLLNIRFFYANSNPNPSSEKASAEIEVNSQQRIC